jgi:hypothetical protein
MGHFKDEAIKQGIDPAKSRKGAASAVMRLSERLPSASTQRALGNLAASKMLAMSG